mmetsp:Transcript_73940/g.208739  ORF Transcript_73940/g.208739 Transcript_73940/m.208739 type:complete len:314 (-) Transcript_73940:314-1255(-)
MAFRAAIFLALMGCAKADAGPQESLESLVSAFDGTERRLGGCKEMRSTMHRAFMCHNSCGTDVACHMRCVNPWKALVQSCRETPAILACHGRCAGDAACGKACPTFPLGWLQAKFEADPDRFAKKAEDICPRLEKAQACHHACAPGDFECHHECPHVWDRHGGHGPRHTPRGHGHVAGPDAKGCYDKGVQGTWCPKIDEWYCVKNCPAGKGCVDKGEFGTWCPKGDGFYCVNCAHGKECVDKGERGTWCPKKDGGWYCVKGCKEEAPANDWSAFAAGMYNKLMAYVPDFSSAGAYSKLMAYVPDSSAAREIVV